MTPVPTATQFASYGSDQGAVLDCLLNELKGEVDGLTSGYVVNVRERIAAIRNAQARLRLLHKLAWDFGLCKVAVVDDEPYVATPTLSLRRTSKR